MRKLTIAMLAVWTVGLSSAGALAYVLVRPPVAPKVAEPAPEPPPAPPPNIESFKVPRPVSAVVSKPVAETKRHVVRGQVRAKLPKRQPEKNRRCSEWRSLAAGPVGQGVRYCD